MKIFLFLFLTIFSSILLATCRGPDSTEDVQKKIDKSEKLSKLDKFCRELPTPAGFEFVDKQISGNSFTMSISYQFRSSLPYSDVRKFYSDLLRSKGWEVGSSGIYERGTQRLSVTTVAFPGADYSVYCAEIN
jgi:hypothetical protein